jgi:hypothetical protein
MQLREQLKTVKTKAEKTEITEKIKHAIKKQRTSEPHGIKGQGY